MTRGPPSEETEIYALDNTEILKLSADSSALKNNPSLSITLNKDISRAFTQQKAPRTKLALPVKMASDESTYSPKDQAGLKARREETIKSIEKYDTNQTLSAIVVTTTPSNELVFTRRDGKLAFVERYIIAGEKIEDAANAAFADTKADLKNAGIKFKPGLGYVSDPERVENEYRDSVIVQAELSGRQDGLEVFAPQDISINEILPEHRHILERYLAGNDLTQLDIKERTKPKNAEKAKRTQDIHAALREQGMSVPMVAADAMIMAYDNGGNFRGLVMIERGNDQGYGDHKHLATPGGFKKQHESIFWNMVREATKEEVLGLGKVTKPEVLQISADPFRDPRSFIVSPQIVVRATPENDLRGGDDAAAEDDHSAAKGVHIIPNRLEFEKAVAEKLYAAMLEEGAADLAFVENIKNNGTQTLENRNKFSALIRERSRERKFAGIWADHFDNVSAFWDKFEAGKLDQARAEHRKQDPSLVKYQDILDSITPGDREAFVFLDGRKPADKDGARIGYFPLTGDPVQNSHLEIPLDMKEKNKLDAVVIVLSLAHADKKSTGAETAERLAMLEAAFAKYPGIYIALSGSGLFADFARNAKKDDQMPKSTAEMIMGADTFIRFLDSSSENLQAMDATGAHVLVIPRLGMGQREVTKLIQENPELPKDLASKIQYTDLKLKQGNVSSSFVRILVSDGENLWRQMVPEDVAALIDRYGLYKTAVDPEKRKEVYSEQREWIDDLIKSGKIQHGELWQNIGAEMGEMPDGELQRLDETQKPVWAGFSKVPVYGIPIAGRSYEEMIVKVPAAFGGLDKASEEKYKNNWPDYQNGYIVIQQTQAGELDVYPIPLKAVAKYAAGELGVVASQNTLLSKNPAIRQIVQNNLSEVVSLSKTQPEKFARWSDLGLSIADEVKVIRHGGRTQIKPAGRDAWVAKAIAKDGSADYYLVQMEENGDPISYFPVRSETRAEDEAEKKLTSEEMLNKIRTIQQFFPSGHDIQPLIKQAMGDIREGRYKEASEVLGKANDIALREYNIYSPGEAQFFNFDRAKEMVTGSAQARQLAQQQNYEEAWEVLEGLWESGGMEFFGEDDFTKIDETFKEVRVLGENSDWEGAENRLREIPELKDSKVTGMLSAVESFSQVILNRTNQMMNESTSAMTLFSQPVKIIMQLRDSLAHLRVAAGEQVLKRATKKELSLEAADIERRNRGNGDDEYDPSVIYLSEKKQGGYPRLSLEGAVRYEYEIAGKAVPGYEAHIRRVMDLLEMKGGRPQLKPGANVDWDAVAEKVIEETPEDKYLNIMGEVIPPMLRLTPGQLTDHIIEIQADLKRLPALGSMTVSLLHEIAGRTLAGKRFSGGAKEDLESRLKKMLGTVMSAADIDFMMTMIEVRDDGAIKMDPQGVINAYENPRRAEIREQEEKDILAIEGILTSENLDKGQLSRYLSVAADALDLMNMQLGSEKTGKIVSAVIENKANAYKALLEQNPETIQKVLAKIIEYLTQGRLSADLIVDGNSDVEKLIEEAGNVQVYLSTLSEYLPSRAEARKLEEWEIEKKRHEIYGALLVMDADLNTQVAPMFIEKTAKLDTVKPDEFVRFVQALDLIIQRLQQIGSAASKVERQIAEFRNALSSEKPSAAADVKDLEATKDRISVVLGEMDRGVDFYFNYYDQNTFIASRSKLTTAEELLNFINPILTRLIEIQEEERFRRSQMYVGRTERAISTAVIALKGIAAELKTARAEVRIIPAEGGDERDLFIYEMAQSANQVLQNAANSGNVPFTFYTVRQLAIFAESENKDEAEYARTVLSQLEQTGFDGLRTDDLIVSLTFSNQKGEERTQYFRVSYLTGLEILPNPSNLSDSVLKVSYQDPGKEAQTDEITFSYNAQSDMLQMNKRSEMRTLESQTGLSREKAQEFIDSLALNLEFRPEGDRLNPYYPVEGGQALRLKSVKIDDQGLIVSNLPASSEALSDFFYRYAVDGEKYDISVSGTPDDEVQIMVSGKTAVRPGYPKSRTLERFSNFLQSLTDLDLAAAEKINETFGQLFRSGLEYSDFQKRYERNFSRAGAPWMLSDFKNMSISRWDYLKTFYDVLLYSGFLNAQGQIDKAKTRALSLSPEQMSSAVKKLNGLNREDILPIQQLRDEARIFGYFDLEGNLAPQYAFAKGRSETREENVREAEAILDVDTVLDAAIKKLAYDYPVSQRSSLAGLYLMQDLKIGQVRMIYLEQGDIAGALENIAEIISDMSKVDTAGLAREMKRGLEIQVGQAIATVISELKKAEAALKRSENRGVAEEAKALAENVTVKVINGVQLSYDEAGKVVIEVNGQNAEAFFNAMRTKAQEYAAEVATALNISEEDAKDAIAGLIESLKAQFTDGGQQSLALALDLEGDKINLERAFQTSDLQGLVSLVLTTKRTGPLTLTGINQQTVNSVPQKTTFSVDNGSAIPVLADGAVNSPVAFGVLAQNKQAGQEGAAVVGLLLQMVSGLLISGEVTNAGDVRNTGNHARLKAELLKKLFGDEISKNVSGAINFSANGDLEINFGVLAEIVQQLAAKQKAAASA